MADERDRLRTLRRLEAEAKAAEKAAAEQKAKEDAYYKRDPKTGLSPAQVDARKALEVQAGPDIKLVTPTGSAGRLVPKPEVPPADGKFTYDYKWVGGSTGGSIGDWQLVKTPIVGATPIVTPTPTPTPVPTPVPTGLDPATQALIKSLQDQIMALTANQQQSKIDAAAAAEAAKKERAQNAISVLTDRFSRYGLASLVPKIRELAISGASEDTIALQLQETEEYKQRFSANQERLKKGLRVLDPGSYIGLEDRYRQILRAYGLKQFDTDSYVTQFLANDTSPEELSSRVVTAVQRVQNADPALVRTLKDFYGIGTTDMVAYVLDPTNQFPKIERQVAAAEIGTAARRQGLEAGVLVSEQLAAQGVTEAEARRGYATIADILPQAGKLSAIYTDVLDQYGQAEAEQEVFNSLASAQRKRRALTEREIASFAGQSGLGRTALGSITGGNI
jgi:hypothetical protein